MGPGRRDRKKRKKWGWRERARQRDTERGACGERVCACACARVRVCVRQRPLFLQNPRRPFPSGFFCTGSLGAPRPERGDKHGRGIPAHAFSHQRRGAHREKPPPPPPPPPPPRRAIPPTAGPREATGQAGPRTHPTRRGKKATSGRRHPPPTHLTKKRTLAHSLTLTHAHTSFFTRQTCPCP